MGREAEGDGMRVEMKIHGHQYYAKVVGEVVAWSTTAEKFGGQWLQVPCVVLMADNGAIESFPLKTELRWTEVTVSEETA